MLSASDLNAAGSSVAELQWYAIHTHPRQESRAVNNLHVWGIQLFAPWIRPHRSSTGRRRSGSEALFPGYIFARFDAIRMLHNIRFTRGVHSVVSTCGKPTPLHEDIIALCRSRVGEDGYVRIARDFKPDEGVIILSGPFKNMIAVFENDLPDQQRVSVLLTAVNWQAHLHLDVSQIAKLPA
jgi:transcriptional antiterminator RfaH